MPANELRAALRAGLSDPGALLHAYALLREATLHVPGTAAGGDRFAAALFESEGISIHVAFTSAADCDAYAATRACFPVPAAALLARAADGVHVLIDPGAEHSIVLNDLIVKAIADGTMFQVDAETFNGSFYTGSVARPRSALKQALRAVLREVPDVEAAVMTIMFEPASAQPPHPVVGLIGRGDFNAIADRCRRAAEAATEERVGFYPVGDDALSTYALRNTIPFYRNDEAERDWPEPMTREELTAVVEAWPEEPTDARSLRELYLNSGMDEEEARDEWQSLSTEQQLRFHTVEAYIEFYRRRKDVERADNSYASTHREARQTLLDALRARAGFSLFLRNFGWEAAEWLEPIPGTGLSRVRWLAFFDRPVEASVAALLRSAGLPVVGLSNPRDALTRLTPIPMLWVANEAWARIMVSLVAAARSIIMSVADLSPGVIEELLTVQRLGREDHTAIVVADEATLADRRKLFHMSSRPAPPDHGPDRHVLARMLATFGHVLMAENLPDAPSSDGPQGATTPGSDIVPPM